GGAVAAEPRHPVEVLVEPVQVVARGLAGRPVADRARNLGEVVPDAAPALGDGPLDLPGAGGDADLEVLGELRLDGLVDSAGHAPTPPAGGGRAPPRAAD